VGFFNLVVDFYCKLGNNNYMNREKESKMVSVAFSIEFDTGETISKEFDIDTVERAHDVIDIIFASLEKSGNVMKKHSVSVSTGQSDLF
jgi:hypothetical protein